MYLLDTNILIEFLLNQERADEVEKFLKKIPADRLFISEFYLYSIGVILIKNKKYETFWKLIKEMIIDGGVEILRLSPYDLERLIEIIQKFNLDFDDAYQYAVAEKYDLKIISFDKDFDSTEKKRLTPKEALKKIG